MFTKTRLENCEFVLINLPSRFANKHIRFAIAIFTEGENVCSVLEIRGSPNLKLATQLKAISSIQIETCS